MYVLNLEIDQVVAERNTTPHVDKKQEVASYFRVLHPLDERFLASVGYWIVSGDWFLYLYFVIQQRFQLHSFSSLLDFVHLVDLI